MNIKDTLKASVAGAALFAVAMPAATPASASSDLVKSGNKNSLTMSGQVNRGVLYMNDGEDDAIAHVDNDNSSTRVRWIGKGKLNEAVTFGTNIEMQAESNSTAQVSIQNHDSLNSGTNGFNQRKLELYIDHKQFGRLWVGQGDPASNGTAEVDLSGSALAGYSGNTDQSGAVAFRTSGNAISTKTNGNVNTNFDGISRNDRLRYDTPSFGGFKLGVTHTSRSQWDVAGRYSGKFGGIKVSGAVAYANYAGGSTTIKSQVNGSISVKHDSGLGVMFSAGKRDMKAAGRNDPDGYYVKLFYDANLFSVGTTAMLIDYSDRSDVNANGDEANVFTAGVVQKLNSIGSEMYLSFKYYTLDNNTTNYDDIIAVLAGARVKF